MARVPDEEVERWMERPHVPEPGDLLDRSGRDIEGEVELGRTALATELDRLKAEGGGVWRRDPDSGDMARVPDEEVERWMERPHVPEPGDLLDRSGQAGHRRGGRQAGLRLRRSWSGLKAQGGGVWRRPGHRRWRGCPTKW